MLPPVLEQSLCEMALQGIPQPHIAAALQVTLDDVKSVLRKHQICLRNGYAKRFGPLAASKLTQEQREELHALIKDPENRFSVLARRFNISRERVRQIAEEIGAPTGVGRRMVRIRKDAQEKESALFQRAHAREQQKDEHYAVWRRLWKEGAKISDIAEYTGLSAKSVGVRITMLRKQHPEWFPYRHSTYEDVPQKLIDRLHELWAQNIPRSRIAKRLHIHDNRLKTLITMERAKNPDALPYRRRPAPKTGPIATPP